MEAVKDLIMRKTGWVKAFLRAMECQNRKEAKKWFSLEVKKRQREMPGVPLEGIEFLIIWNLTYLSQRLDRVKKYEKLFRGVK